MIKKFFVISLLILTSFLTFAQTDFISVKGKDFVDASGNKLLLKGINLGNWLVPEGYMFKFEYTSSPRLIYELFDQMIGPDEAKKFWKQFRDNYITLDDIKFIKQTGFNSVRIPFNYRLFVIDDDPNKLEGPGYELLDRAIEWCKQENLFVVLDMHCAPGGQTGDNIDDSFGYPFLFENPESQILTAAIWKKLAEKYSDEKIIIGYDLLNEPIAHYFDQEKLNPLLEPLYKKIVAAVREVDTNHLIFLGGAQWDSNFKIFGPPFDSKLVYTFHKYWTDTDESVIKEYLEFRDKYNVPLYMGESGENTNEWITEFRKTLDRNEIGWCFWPYKKLDSERGPVSIKITEEYKEIIEFANGERVSFEDLRKNRPDTEIIKKALTDYLENIKFKNCVINKDYIKALGLE
ncbi:MAG TPA: cellulase family glycosylhydrolase [Ignavibacteriaceae bacterium]|nr:cellulase family glycosylhydrolase [Ignavibacteriaceae bacterium]